MKHLKLLQFLVVSIFIFGAVSSLACISLPKNVKLQNSPFPFSEFDIYADSFSYKTSDGMFNRLSCDVNKGYSWSANTKSIDGKKASYAYEDLKDANIYVDDKEEGPNTTLKLGNTGDMAYASIRKKGSQASLQIVCTKEGNIRKLAVKVINSQGQAVGEISSSIDMTAPKTRAVGNEKGSIDFNSSNQVGGEFMSSGCGQQEEIKGSSSESSSQ